MPRPASILSFSVAAALAAAAGAQVKMPPNAFNDRLLKLAPDKQRAAMRQAITNNAQICGRVERVAFQGPFGNLQMWTVTCTPGGDYAVFVGSDQSVQVRVCNQMTALKLPHCRGR